jgi:hypothetical protein
MKSNEQQEEFNMKLMQSLNIVKNLDKESGSSKSRNHSSPNEKKRTRSVSIHHHHSPRYSNRREHNISSPSLVRKHKGSEVDELRGEMNKIKPPTFDGDHKKDEYAETWLLGIRKYFQFHNCSFHLEGRIVICQLKGKESM